MALKRVNQPQRLAPVPPAPGSDPIKVSRGERVVSLLPEPRRDPGSLYQPRVSPEMAAILYSIRKGR